LECYLQSCHSMCGSKIHVGRHGNMSIFFTKKPNQTVHTFRGKRWSLRWASSLLEEKHFIVYITELILIQEFFCYMTNIFIYGTSICIWWHLLSVHYMVIKITWNMILLNCWLNEGVNALLFLITSYYFT
jgi:hypothetical protein